MSRSSANLRGGEDGHAADGLGRARPGSPTLRTPPPKPAPTPSTLESRIRQATEGHKPTPLAEMLGLHPETVRRYLSGQRPSPEFLIGLCKKLNISGDWLLLGIGPMHRAPHEWPDNGTDHARRH